MSVYVCACACSSFSSSLLCSYLLYTSCIVVSRAFVHWGKYCSSLASIYATLYAVATTTRFFVAALNLSLSHNTYVYWNVCAHCSNVIVSITTLLLSWLHFQRKMSSRKKNNTHTHIRSETSDVRALHIYRIFAIYYYSPPPPAPPPFTVLSSVLVSAIALLLANKKLAFIQWAFNKMIIRPIYFMSPVNKRKGFSLSLSPHS